MENLKMTWDLESLFAGGSNSPALASFVEETERRTGALLEALKTAERRNAAEDQNASKEQNAAAGRNVAEGQNAVEGQSAAKRQNAAQGRKAAEAQLTEWTEELQTLAARRQEADAFVSCLAAQRMSDKRAAAWTDRLQTLYARQRQAMDLFDARLAALDETDWNEWIGRPELAPIAFPLAERREASREKLPPALESVAGELAVDGYHGWGEHYNTIVSRIAIPWEQDGQAVSLSAGQAANRLSDPDPAVRGRMSALWEEAWSGQADLCADTLNRLAGFRLKLYGLRGWDDPLREPLKLNRMSAGTLQAMWDAVAGGVAPLRRYLELKAGLLGQAKLNWHDVDAPLSTAQAKIPYAEAAQMIVGAFERFSPNMAALARRAFADGWIEAEDRPGKRPGGFCTSLPLRGQSRIFMTYSGTADNVSTLAHELGHAYHGELVHGLPPFAQDYAMNVAETASTFAEALVGDELLERAASREAKLALLDDRLQRAVAFCMNIRARFLFETRFYARRGAGMLEASELNGLMLEAQREAFGDVLENGHPGFWASKLHFYLTDVPFYNFPYTFGYLFSTGLIAAARSEGAGFPDRYDRLLRDTGLMTVEALAERHLGISLEEPAFWREAMKQVAADAEAFAVLAGNPNA